MAGTKQVGLTFGEGTPEWQHLERECRKHEYLTPTNLSRRYLNQRIQLAESGLPLKADREIAMIETILRDPKFLDLCRRLADLPSNERKERVIRFIKDLHS